MIMQHLRIASGGENFSHSRKYRSRTIASDFLVRDAVRSEAVSVSRIPIWMGIYWEILRFFMPGARSEEHTSELQSLMRISYAVFCLKKKTKHENRTHITKHVTTNKVQGHSVL